MMALMDHVRKRDLPPEIKCRQVICHQSAPSLYSLCGSIRNFGGIVHAHVLNAARHSL